MIEGNSSWICQRQSAWQSHNCNCLTANAIIRQLDVMPVYVSPQSVSANVGLNGYHTSDSPVDKGVKIKDGLLQCHSFPHIEASIPTMNLYPNEQQLLLPSGLDGKATPHETSYSQQKKFLIFDRSGEETRMILSTLHPPICNPAAFSTNPVSTYEFHEKLHAFKLEQSCPVVPDLFGDLGENHVTDEGSDYHEDTEEINALLYSSDDDIDENIYDSEDEDEMSTDHSPIAMGAGFDNREEEGEEFDDEATSLWCSSKRRKILDSDSCSKQSLMDTKATAKSAPQFYEDETVVNQNSSNAQQAFLTVNCKRLRKHKIHDTLRILQKLIPGSKSKDPSVIIDEAISYLKSLKDMSPDMEEAESSSCLGPLL